MWRKNRFCRWAAISPRPAIFRTPHSRHDRAILMGKDSDAFNRWEAGQSLAAEIMLEVAGEARGDANTDYIAAIGDVLARAEEDPAFAAQMLMPPTESELAATQDAGGSGRHPHRPRRPGARHRAGPSRQAGPALRAYARCRRFQPGRQRRRAGAPCAMRLCAISPPPTTKPPRAWPTRITAAPPT